MITAGANPGTVYTETEVLQGKCPAVGAMASTVDSQGSKVFVMCKVAASQNLTNGHVVTVANNFVVTVAAANTPAIGRSDMLAIAVCSVTASASTQIWCQVYGRGNVQASLSALPNIA